MSGIRIKMIDGEATLLIDRSEGRLRNLAPVMAAIAGEVDDRVQESFEHKRDPVDLTAWPELRAATVADRVSKGFNAADMLQRTGVLRSSVVTDSDDQGVTTSVRGVEYALIHHKGSSRKKVPQRRFAGISQEDSAEFEDMIAAFITDP